MKSEQLINCLECVYCDKKFNYDSERKRHEKSHTPQFKCKSCGKVFGFLSALRRHEQQHKRASIVECETCNKQFKDDTLLQRHIKYAHEGNHKCDKCSTTFPSKLALGAHLKSHKPVSERKFKCKHKGCSKAFNYRQHLKHHELAHTDTKAHYCNVCGKGFIQYHHLKTHLKVHEPEKWLPCLVDSCMKKFPTKYSRRRHLKSHKQEEFKPKSEYDSKVEKDKVFCETCGKLISRQRYPKHCMVCKKEDQYDEVMGKVDSPCVTETQKHEDKVDVEEKDNLDGTFDCNVSNCISVTGHCLAKHELSQDCLCAQIKHEDSEIVDFMEPKEPLPVSVSDNADIKKNKKLSNDNSACDGCSVLDLSSKPCTKENTRSKCCQTMPKIEYVSGGIVKIKDLIDDSIKLNKGNIDYRAKSNVEVNNTESVMFNSCKAVLGKCLASEDGTMGKGCLCAEMLNDNYPLDSQQIDEITPNPNISYS